MVDNTLGGLRVDALFHQLPDVFAPRAHIVFPDMNSRELLTYMADELSAPPADAPRYTSEESVQRIKRMLESNAERGRHAVLAIDEAHLLEENGTLETVRLLLNFTVASRPLLTVLLVGQSALLPQLARSPGLEQRLGVKTLLRPFSLEETVSYVNHRLSAAGASRTIFEESALETLHELSSGIPRSINRLADLALLVGYADQIATLSAEHVRSVCEELVTVAKG